MKNIIIILAGMFIQQHATAQSIENTVVASGGTSYTHPSAQLEYTIGEVFTNTLNSPNNSITQGFHQPALIVTQLLANAEGVFEEAKDEELRSHEQAFTEDQFNVEVYPNPAVDYLNIVPKGLISEKVSVSLFTGKGDLIQSIPVTGEILKLEFRGLAPGTYVVNVISDSGRFNNHYRIVKTK